MANAGIERREDVKIPFKGELMAGWLYRSTTYSASRKGPAIVLGHGLGATKELKLDVYADKFNRTGYTALAFDYRCNGESTGLPRGLIDWNAQQEDWHAALEYVRSLEYVDSEQIGIFGTSFGGGHVIQVGATDKRIKAVISQCPFTDGIRSAFTTGLAIPCLLLLGLRDLFFGTDEDPVVVSLVGQPGETALMNAHDVWSGFWPLIPESFTPRQFVPARIVPHMPFLRPGSYAAAIDCPILIAICGKDTVAPPAPTLRYAKQAPKGTIKWYDDMGHFDIYVGEKHERAFADYAEFLKTNLPV